MRSNTASEMVVVGGHGKRRPTAVFRRLGQSNTGGLLLLIAITWVVYGTFGQGFLSSFNLFSLSQLAAETAVIGFAQLAVLVVARMNLAVGAVGVCVAMFTGWLIGVQNINPVLGIIAGFLLGAAAGAVMGWLELKTKLNSFVVTLAMSSVYIGVMLILSKGVSVSTLPESVSRLGYNNLVISYLSYLIIPTLVVAAALWYLYQRTSLGWKMLAVGANETAARLSGVRTSRVLLASFALSGLLCGVAAMMETARVSAALPTIGTDWLLPAFIVPVLGGTSLRGGSVSIGGAILAAIFLASINSGLISMNVTPYWLVLAQSVVLLAAVVIDEARRRRRRHVTAGGLVEAEAARSARGRYA